MKNFVFALLVGISFTACKAENHAPNKDSKATTAIVVDSAVGSFTQLDDTTQVEFLAIGKVAGDTKMTEWKESFRPVSMIGGLPELGESLVITRCDEGKKVKYCSTVFENSK